MKKATGTGTVYTSRNLTRHYVSALCTAVLAVVGLAAIAVLIYPPLLDWWLS